MCHVLGTRAAGVEDLDGKQLGLLGNAVGLGADGAGNVGAVALAVGGVLVGEVLEPGGAALELGVVDVNAGVDDVGASALAGRLVVGVGGTAGLGAGDTGQAPGSILLGGGNGDDGILLDEVDLYRLSVTVPPCSSVLHSRWGRS